MRTRSAAPHSAADVFALLIENARLNERVLEQERLRRDLGLAAEVQRRLLPPQSPACADATFAAFMRPARTGRRSATKRHPPLRWYLHLSPAALDSAIRLLDQPLA